MEIPISSKVYSFHEAFDAVGRKLVPGWTGEETQARECHAPEDVAHRIALPKRLLQFIKENPGLNAKDRQSRITGVKVALHDRRFGPLAPEIKAFVKDPDAYQVGYDLWDRRRVAEASLNDIIHDGHTAAWIETLEGDIQEIPRTHWPVRGTVGGPFTPNLPGNCGEYRGVDGMVWIDKESLDRFLGTPDSLPAAGPGRPVGTTPEKRQEYERWAEASQVLKANHSNWSMDQAMDQAAKDMGIKKSSFKRRLFEQNLVKTE